MSALKLGSVVGVDIFRRTTLFKGTENSLKQNFVELKASCGATSKIFTGLEWECVEFARRYLAVVHGVAFEQVKSAVDLWDCPELKHLQSQQSLPWEKIHNAQGCVATLPEVGDLVVYPKQKCPLFYDHGHVAVVTQVCGDHLHVAEQNVQFGDQGKSLFRVLKIHFENQLCVIEDPLCEVLGWLKAPKCKL
jgi:glutathionylspermidine amidase/synthetase